MTTAPNTTPITDDQMHALTAPLNPARVSSRKQGGRNLSYVEAWDIKATLIRVFGFAGFSAEVTKAEIIDIEKTPQLDEQGVKTHDAIVVLAQCTVRLTIHQTGAVYEESAAASQKGRDVGEVADFALKTAESDALKRAAIYLGTQFGLSLYDNGSTNDVVRVVLAPNQVWPLARREQVQAQQAAQTVNAIVERQGPPPGSSLTPEAHAEAQALVERGLRMKAAQEPQGVDFAKMAEEAMNEPGVPVALDPALEPGFETQHADTVSQ